VQSAQVHIPHRDQRIARQFALDLDIRLFAVAILDIRIDARDVRLWLVSKLGCTASTFGEK